MSDLNDILGLVDNSLTVDGPKVTVTDKARFRAAVGRLVEASALRTGAAQGWARYLVRAAAPQCGILPSSIHDLYMAKGRGDVPLTFTVPAMNLRVLSFDAARAVFRVARRLNAGAFIFEIARSEIGYTAQRPAEYATNILAAGIAEEWTGPVFLQGDHFQVSAKKYASSPQAEVEAVKQLVAEAVAAGFYNIDIDTSTLVDVSKPEVVDQQKINVELSAEFGSYVRECEPQGLTISLGGEIGEVGGHNSTVQELRVFMDGVRTELGKRAPGKPGLSKISIQTGTSHGGTVLPNGTLAQVNIDFRTLRELSAVARREYGLGGAVQHGASTLPEDAFHQFVENEAVEVHLATSFMTMFYDLAPAQLRNAMYAWLDKNEATERKPGMTDEQFYYKTRKNAIGPFKSQLYALSEMERSAIAAAWEKQFEKLFRLLGMQDTKNYVTTHVRPLDVGPKLDAYIGKEQAAALADDLQD